MKVHDHGMDQLDQLLTAQDLAGYLEVPVATIYAWRHRRQGPPGFKVTPDMSQAPARLTTTKQPHDNRDRPPAATSTADGTSPVRDEWTAR